MVSSEVAHWTADALVEILDDGSDGSDEKFLVKDDPFTPVGLKSVA